MVSVFLVRIFLNKHRLFAVIKSDVITIKYLNYYINTDNYLWLAVAAAAVAAPFDSLLELAW